MWAFQLTVSDTHNDAYAHFTTTQQKFINDETLLARCKSANDISRVHFVWVSPHRELLGQGAQGWRTADDKDYVDTPISLMAEKGHHRVSHRSGGLCHEWHVVIDAAWLLGVAIAELGP